MSNTPTNDLWPSTRAQALQRLEDFIPHAAGDYARGRNFDFGAGRHDKVSVLSPYIRHRLITETEVVEAALARHDLRSAEKFIQEVMWRGYFKGWLEHKPEAWRRYKAGVKAGLSDCGANANLNADYRAAISGRTGITCFDHWAEELTETGYLHNHARMWFASIWIFTLRLPWELGADFFMQHLLDGDPASNTLSWRWVGGLHTKGKTYLARADNIAKFTNGRFNPQGQLASEAPPLEEPDLPGDGPLPQSDIIPDGQRLGFILHDGDCHPESLGYQRPLAAMALSCVNKRSPAGADAKTARFTAAALEDGLSRFGDACNIPTETGGDADWDSALIPFAKQHDLDGFVMAYAPVGPVQDSLNGARGALSAKGLKLYQIVRDYDAALWPYANRGFFKLKKKMPQIIDGLGLDRQGKLL